jgi:hypothetical protein
MVQYTTYVPYVSCKYGMIRYRTVPYLPYGTGVLVRKAKALQGQSRVSILCDDVPSEDVNLWTRQLATTDKVTMVG